MNVTELLGKASDAMSVERVFAPAYEKDGLTVLPAAAVAGGAGGGSGTDPGGEAGEGGGFAARARPVGAYVIRDGRLTWRPAIDVNRLSALVCLVVIAFLLRRPRAQAQAPTSGGV